MDRFSILVILAAAMILFSGCVSTPGTGPVFPPKPTQPATNGTPSSIPITASGMKTFSSWDEVSSFLRSLLCCFDLGLHCRAAPGNILENFASNRSPQLFRKSLFRARREHSGLLPLLPLMEEFQDSRHAAPSNALDCPHRDLLAL